jgi:hypothetical protein
MHVFSLAEGLVQADRRGVSRVRLYEDDIDPTRFGYMLEFPEIYELHIDNEVLQVQIKAGEIHVQQGNGLTAEAIFETDMPTYLGLLLRQIQPDQAISQGLIQVEGAPAALGRFLNLCGLPSSN